MTTLLVVVIALLLGAAAGAAAVWARSRSAAPGAADAVRADLAAQAAEIRRLADSGARREEGSAEIRREISGFRESLERMRAREEERRAREDEGWAALQRVSAVLAGSHASGRAGERVLLEALSCLPPSMIVRDFRVNGRVVEFGLVLPDGRRLPVDSKWPAQRELAAVGETDDPVERERLERIVERAIADRAREVAGYLDPDVTAPLAVAAIPDGAYAIARRAHADAYRDGVIVVSYSMALPLLLFAYELVSRYGGEADTSACLADVSAVLDALEATLENKLARASTMLANGTDEVRRHLGKARGTLARSAAVTGDDAVEPPAAPGRPAGGGDPPMLSAIS